MSGSGGYPGGIDLREHGKRATAIVERLAGKRAPLDGVTAMRELGQREKAEAVIWLRKRVNEVRVDLGLPTVGEEARAKLRADLKRFADKMAELGRLYQPPPREES